MLSVAGIDVSKRTLDVFASGKWKQVKNDASGFGPLQTFLKAHKVEWVILEATGTYHEAVACALCEAGYSVAVVNPARTHFYAKSLGKRVKTDKVDAQVLAQFGASQHASLERFVPPSPEVRRFKSLVRLRHDLVRTSASVKGRLKGVGLDEFERKLLQEQLKFTKAQIAELDRQIRALSDASPELTQKEQLLLTIPGVGTITAWTLIAEIGDFSRFPSAKQVAAFAGVCPSFRHSGTSLQGSGRMSGAGNPTVRKLLYLAAMASIRYEGIFLTTYERMVKAGKVRMCALVVVMHKLLRIAYGVVKSGTPFKSEGGLTPTT